MLFLQKAASVYICILGQLTMWFKFIERNSKDDRQYKDKNQPTVGPDIMHKTIDDACIM